MGYYGKVDGPLLIFNWQNYVREKEGRGMLL